jgi:hypothetical protein
MVTAATNSTSLILSSPFHPIPDVFGKLLTLYYTATSPITSVFFPEFIPFSRPNFRQFLL